MVGAPRAFVGADPSPYGVPPEVMRDEPSAMVTCRSSNRSEEFSAFGHCWKTGAAGWKMEGDFHQLIACGDWVVVIEGKRAVRLVAYSLATGKAAMRIDEPVPPVITCADPGVLLVGERRLVMFELPHRRPIWTSKPNRGRITFMAATEHAIAFSDLTTEAIMIIPRPTSAELR
jgi:hypothetical protein